VGNDSDHELLIDTTIAGYSIAMLHFALDCGLEPSVVYAFRDQMVSHDNFRIKMAYWKFLKRHPRLLSFGVMLTLFSSFGQTFLISIFVPQILEDFALNSGQFGTLYAAATLCSAMCLPFFGRLLDQTDLGRYTLTVGLALVLACWTMALAPTVPILFIALLGLRLTGQGLLSLTASTAMARLFTDFRGRALSISGTGYPIGEGLLPIILVVLLQRFGWRISWGIAGLFIALVFLPLIRHLVRDVQSLAGETKKAAEKWSRKELLTDWRFYLFLPGVLTVPFLLTGIFLYQTQLAEFKQTSAGLMATGFTAYALTRMFSSMGIGPWVDRFSASRIFPYLLVPITVGLIFLRLQSASWSLYLFFISAGMSQGVSRVIMASLWAQRYRPDVLGRVKSLVAMLVVISTALSPVLFGWLLASGVSFSVILPSAVVLCMGSIGTGIVAQRLCFHSHS
jgi:MFS family permease